MLVALRVSNFAIIDNLIVQFKPGLNVLSGETGAGKSVLLKSLSLLMGEKASGEAVRSGAEVATIEGSFDLSRRPDIINRMKEIGIDTAEESLVVRRQVSIQGKSKVVLNGSLCSLSDLRELITPMIAVAGHAAPLIEMTGQHDTRHLMSKGYHLDLLDTYMGLWPVRKSMSETYSQLYKFESEFSRLTEEARTQAQRLDFLIYQRDEILALGLEPGQDVEIEAEAKRLKNASRLFEFVEFSESCLHGDEDSTLVRLHRVISRAQELTPIDTKIATLSEPLIQAKSLIQDALYEMRGYVQNIQGQPDRLLEIEETVSKLRKLQKKYGASLAEILQTLSKICIEIEGLENSEVRLNALQKEISKFKMTLHSLAEQLHSKRQSGIKDLTKSVNDELLDLNMKGVKFLVRIVKAEEISASGNTDLEFMIFQGNSKSDKKNDIDFESEAKPLGKYASGGELSRILLSLKSVMGRGENPRSYLFDEVDTGVSGETAEKVGRKLSSIAEGQQVICVTHSPQVASFADHHFLISKSAGSKQMQMEVSELESEERVNEIARMISGEKISKTSIDHAKSLLSGAQKHGE